MRPDRDPWLMGMARVVAQRGTCSRLNVGAIIALDGRVLSMGYNGAPAGMPHCDHECVCMLDYRTRLSRTRAGDLPEHMSRCPADKPCTIAVHAEANAIAFAARHGVSVEGADLFTTAAPCSFCAQLVVNCGLQRVVYATEFRDMAGVEMLRKSGKIAVVFLP